MSQFSAMPVPPPRGGVMPQGDEVASFASYAEAQHAVDSLSDDGFPVQYLAIIGTDLRQVERITGRMSWGRAVASGASSGLWIGLFFAAMMALIGPGSGNGANLMVAAVLLGVVWGIIFQAGAYALTRGRRDFTSVSQVVASRYSIIASLRAEEAARALERVPGNLARGRAAARAQERRSARERAGSGPTAFGSRPNERPRFGVRVPEGVDPSDYDGGRAADGADGDPQADPDARGRDEDRDGQDCDDQDGARERMESDA